MKKIIMLLSIVFLFSCNNNAIEKILDRNNRLSGTQLDNGTTFIKAFIVKNNFYYYYTLNNCDSEDKGKQNELVYAFFEKQTSTNLKSIINSGEEFKIIGENDYNIIFKYHCDDGRKISEIKFEYVEGGFNYVRGESEWNEAADLMFEILNN